MTGTYFIAFFSIFICVYCQHYEANYLPDREVSYEGYKVYNLHPDVISQQFALEILLQNSTFDFWTKRSLLDGDWTVMVPPRVLRDFQNYLRKFRINHEEIIRDVEEEIQKNEASELVVVEGEISFQQYEDVKTIYTYLKQLVHKYSHVSLLILGETWNKKEILGIKISSNNKMNNPGILIASGLNAREWIGPAGALYVIDQLANNPINNNMYQNVDWFIIPLLNPDGYENSQLIDRMWQKNLSPRKLQCDGVDISKNFDFHWGESGSLSYDECDQEYIGRKAFSEPESITLHRFMTTLGGNVKLYLSLHSFGPMILYPWSHSSMPLNDVKEVRTMAEEVSEIIYTHTRTKYRVDSYVTAVYSSGGTDIDWMKGVSNVSWVYSFHMPGRGSNMFDPIESEIEEVVKELFIGVQMFRQQVENKWVRETLK